MGAPAPRRGEPDRGALGPRALAPDRADGLSIPLAALLRRQLAPAGGAALALGAAAGLAGCSPGAPDALPERPGIVLVIGDDVGWSDYGFMGSELARTPHLDALAAEGVLFTHAFTTASVCRPSLQSLLTGLLPYEIEARFERMHGVPVGTQSISGSFATLPRLLVERGYAAFQGGKFWEGDPLAAGFTHALTEWPPWQERPLPDLMRVAGGYALALGRETLDPLFAFLDAYGDEPFFVWYAPMLPHPPFDAAARYAEPYRDLPLPPEARGYYANLSRFDDGVGEILAFLERRGLRERTAILYAADNGWNASQPTRDREISGLGGEGAKLTIRERGFRTPVIVSWPGTLPKGRRDDRLVSLVDVFATVLDLAGADTPLVTDARSLLPLVTGRGGSPREHVVGSLREDDLEHLARSGRPVPHSWYLRTPEWRYDFSVRDGREALYRIEEDAGEVRDLAGAHPEVLARLRKALVAEIDAMDRAVAETPTR